MKVKLVKLKYALTYLNYLDTFTDVHYKIIFLDEKTLIRVTDKKSGRSVYTHISNIQELIVEDVPEEKKEIEIVEEEQLVEEKPKVNKKPNKKVK